MAKNRNHQFIKCKFMPFHHCFKCGLIALNNERTKKALNKPCTGGEDE